MNTFSTVLMLQGVSDQAYMFCHQHNGLRLHVPLRNCVNSLNVISAASLVLFKVQEVLDRVRRGGVVKVEGSVPC